jgi:hypothetical protein
METLIIKVHPFTGEITLWDAFGHRLSAFPSIEAAKQWCEENNYRCRVQKS